MVAASSCTRACLAVIVLLCVASQAGWAVRISQAGKPEAVIVVASDALAPEKHAAAELQSFLEQVSGARLPIQRTVSTAPMILVGPGAARMVDAKFSVDGLGTDGIRIRTIGPNLILAGGRPRGTLYAVYTFLEDHVGCRWWAPGASTIPHKPTLWFEKIDRTYLPQFEYREPYWHSAFDRDWAVRNKAVGTRLPLDAKVGGKPPIWHINHSFYQLIPPSRYFKDHPEWFSEIKGKRSSEYGQLCLTNVQMREEMVRNILRTLRSRPDTTNISVAQNDGGVPCQCAKCAAVQKEEGSPSGAIIRFVNAVGQEIEKEFPNVVLSTFAYTYSEVPPRITRPRKNVLVWLCTMNASYNLPLNACKRNAQFAQNLEGWSKLTDRLYIWDYVTNFRHYLFIHPNLRVLGPNIRFFADSRVRGVFEQGAAQTAGAEMMELRSWVISKLLWDPRLDDDRLIDEFVDGYYGSAGKHIRKYIDVIHDVNQQMAQPLGCYEEPNRRFMDPAILAQAYRHMKDAEAAVAGDPVLTKRVRLAQMPLMYAYMVRWTDMKTKSKEQGVEWPMGDDPYAVLADYKARVTEFGISYISEQQKIDKLEEKLNLPKKG